MMRALYSAASGMIAEQQNVDSIANNLANVNTTGYKKERMEFQTLLYQTLQRADKDPANPTGRPVNLQIGLGVRPVAVSKLYAQGNLQTTGNATDVAIAGNGFFAIQRGGTDGDIVYTKDGTFKVAPNDNGDLELLTSDGYHVLDTSNAPIVFPANTDMNSMTIAEDGMISYYDSSGNIVSDGTQINIVQFPNVEGLQSIGQNLLTVTPASGQPIQESSGDIPAANRSQLKQGVLEMSNVQVAEEMVNLIVAQRAYDLNSKAIQTSDEMLQTANTLKR